MFFALSAVFAACGVFGSCADERETAQESGGEAAVARMSDEMAAVRDLVPLYAVVAHRGTTYWAPEETEAAWRWAREMGADYLESDLQSSKDGVLLANHDESLRRTTDIDAVYGGKVPSTRRDFYRSFVSADGTQLFTEDDIEAQLQRDEADFVPYRTASYYYHELLALDAGAWFNTACPERARASFAKEGGTHLYVSALQDQMAYATGRMLRRDAEGERVLPYRVKDKYRGMTLAEIYASEKSTAKCDEAGVAYAFAQSYMDFVEYDFAGAYTDDPQDTGHRPGLYIEFKKPEANPGDMEVRTYNLLADEGWNAVTEPVGDAPFYKDGRVNVGKTDGRVILQTFSKDALGRAFEVFKGKVPMCYLLWRKDGDAAAQYDTREGYAAFIKEGLENGAHIMGPSIAGEPGNYAELDAPWQAALTRQAGMLCHPYTFDTEAQMDFYTGHGDRAEKSDYDTLLRVAVPPTAYTVFAETDSAAVRLDGLFTNRADLSLSYLIAHGLRCNAALPNPLRPGRVYDNSQAPAAVSDAEATLRRLGY